jgi:hypothetical protein
LVRAVIFWNTFAAGLAALAEVAPYSRWQHVSKVIREVSAGNIEHVSEKTFAFALSSGICQVAIAFAFAFFVSHVVLLRAAVRAAKGSLGRSDDISSFAQAFDKISDRLERNAVVRHGWRQFAATTIRESTSVRYTVRPQNFINLADARGELFGLKMMGSIPGYFVGLGLLLTFIGLVFPPLQKMTERLTPFLDELRVCNANGHIVSSLPYTSQSLRQTDRAWIVLLKF